MKPEYFPQEDLIKADKIDKQSIFLDTDKEVFEKGFGPKEYMKTYYPERLDSEKILWASKKIKEQFKKDSKLDINNIIEKFGVSCEVAENLAIFDFQGMIARKLLEHYPKDNIEVLDVGGGPTIYQHIAMSLEAGNITHSEFLEQNRKEVSSWLNNEKNSHNWDAYFDLITKMLNQDEEYQAILSRQLESKEIEIRDHSNLVSGLLSGNTENFKNHLKKELEQNIVHGDVFSSDLGLPNSKKYDVATSGREGSVEMLTSNFTIESATGDRGKWEQGMKNITAKIKNKGFLALTAIRNAEWYAVGEEKMPAVKVNENDIEAILNKEGFEIIEMRILEGSDEKKVGYDGMVFVFAQKIN